MPSPTPSPWPSFNAAQQGRRVRELALLLIEQTKADFPEPRNVIILDVGAGAGIETAAFLAEGWKVFAYDSADGSQELIEKAAGVYADNLIVSTQDFAEIDNFPAAQLLYSGFALPFADPATFEKLWNFLLEALPSGSLWAFNLLGVRDEWARAQRPFTFHSRGEVEQLLAGFDLLLLEEEEGERPAFQGSKHWHNFNILARRR